MDDKPLILGVETSTRSGSVALVKGGQLIGLQHYQIDKSHSALLHEMIDQMINNAGFTLNDLKAIAVSEGPGSYTGLRIGVSAVKGLCYALDLPMIAIHTLEAMAFQVNKYTAEKTLLCPMIDARRMEVYAAVWDSQMNLITPTAPVIVDENSFAELLSADQVLFFGDGSNKCKKVIRSDRAHFLQDIVPLASDIALMAESKFENQQFVNMVSFEPYYLKEYRIIAPKTSVN